MHPVRQRKNSPVQHGSNTAWQPGVHQMTSHPSICQRVRTSDSGWNVAPRQPHEWLLWKSPNVPAETEEELAHTILTQHQRLSLTEKNDQQVTPSGPPSPKGLRPGIQDLATKCPNHQFFSRNAPGHQICRVVHPWTMWPSLLRSQRLDFIDAIGNESFPTKRDTLNPRQGNHGICPTDVFNIIRKSQGLSDKLHQTGT